MSPIPDRALVVRVAFDATRRVLPRVILATGVVYLVFACLYATAIREPGRGLLVALTGVSGAGFVLYGRIVMTRGLSVRHCHAAIGGASAVIIANIAAEYAVSRSYLHGVGFLLVQLAAGMLIPTVPWLLAFFAANTLAWLAATLAAGIGIHAGDAALAFSCATLIATVLFYARARTTALVESLRQSVEESRDLELRAVLDSNADAILLHRAGVLVYANAALVAQLRCESGSDCVGTPLSRWAAPDQSTRLAALLADGPGASTHMLELVRTDGEVVMFEISRPRTIRFQGEQVVMLVGRDVTASQLAIRAQLVFADRMATAGMLAAGLAHELNSPLAAAQLNLSVLAEQVAPADADSREIVAEAAAALARVVAIVSDLHAISPYASEHDIDDVEVAQVVAHAIKLTSNEIRHRAEVVAELRDAPVVRLNRATLTQALINLLGNAARDVDDGRGGHTICVRTGTDARGRATIEIADDGPGLSPEGVEHVFDPFFSNRADGLGAGLGLYYCHSVVTAAGGTIEVASQLGAGTTFRLALPPAPMARKVSSVMNPSNSPALQILVVDDEPAVGRSIKRALADCAVTVSTSGGDAVAQYEAVRPDLVLCDVMMPGLSGPALYEQLRARHPEIERQIVFMTGGAFTKPTREFVETTSATVLKKPISITALRELVGARRGAPRPGS